VTSAASEAVDALAIALDALLGVDLASVSGDGLLEAARRFETLRRRLPVFDHALITEVDTRGLAHELCVPSTAALWRGLLNISPGEAKRRVGAAAALGPRRTLTGDVLPPLFGETARVQAAGLIAAEHAYVITTAVDALPAAVAADHEARVEAVLVEHALVFDPHELGKLARRMHDVLNPDGTLTDEADHQRRRGFVLHRHRDGSSSPDGRFTPELTVLFDTALDCLAPPRPAVDGVRDDRTPQMRNHDALIDILRRVLRSDLPDTGGLPTMLILTANVTDAQAGTGFASTPHGGLSPIGSALDLVGAGPVTSVLFSPHGGIHDYGQTKRIVPPGMRLALIARDKGCTMPGCDRPPAYTEAHHIDEYVGKNGPTSLLNCLLACSWHHREFGRRGWYPVMLKGVPYWVPPAWIDPHRTPRKNTTHDPPLRI
jgi:hypothetical protein